MSNQKSLSLAGKIIIIFLLALLLMIVASVLYGFALLNGRAPVPKLAVSAIADRAGLPEGEQENLEKALNIYSIVQKSDVSGDIKALRKSAVRGASEEEIVALVHTVYTTLPDDTLNEIREELEMTPEDFSRGMAILDKGMADFPSTGGFRLSTEDEKTLRALAEKYGLSNNGLDEWSASF